MKKKKLTWTEKKVKEIQEMSEEEFNLRYKDLKRESHSLEIGGVFLFVVAIIIAIITQ